MTAALEAPEPSVRDDWCDQTERLLLVKVTEARQLRAAGDLPSPEHGPEPLYLMLIDVRHRLDAVEVLQSEVLAFRTSVRVLLKEADAAVEDKWASRVAQPRSSRRGSFDGSFDAAPREKYAEADLAVLEDRRKARRRDRVLDACNDAVEQLRNAHRGLDGLRMDLHVLVRGLSVETRLER